MRTAINWAFGLLLIPMWIWGVLIVSGSDDRLYSGGGNSFAALLWLGVGYGLFRLFLVASDWAEKNFPDDKND